ncbi:MAG: Lpg1974 family pore-forming outer membrane protein [Simkaniaceae bacterium]|nr:Lpg1974 family pore-forming outer membrane protein [Simkaniaceae bacterium]
MRRFAPLLIFFAQAFGNSHDGMNRPTEVTPTASPHVDNGADVFVSGDFLYWSVTEDGLDFATSGYAATPTTQLLKGQTHGPGFNWHPGFRAALGFVFAHDEWDLLFQYTWMHATEQVMVSQQEFPSNFMMIANWIFDPTETVKRVTRATGGWSDVINVGDVTFGRNFYLSYAMSIHPHVGLKAGWQMQQNKVFYQETSPTTGDITETRLWFKERFFGIGLLGGLDMAFHLSQMWSIFGDFAASALASRFNVEQKASQFLIINGVQNGADVIPLYYEGKYWDLTPVLEWSGGLRCDFWLNRDAYHMMIQAGWEQQVWLNMNRFNNEFNGGSSGDLNMQGVTIRVRFDF